MDKSIFIFKEVVKVIEVIYLRECEKVQKYFINNKKGESSDDGDSSFILFIIKV